MEVEYTIESGKIHQEIYLGEKSVPSAPVDIPWWKNPVVKCTMEPCTTPNYVINCDRCYEKRLALLRLVGEGLYDHVKAQPKSYMPFSWFQYDEWFAERCDVHALDKDMRAEDSKEVKKRKRKEREDMDEEEKEEAKEEDERRKVMKGDIFPYTCPTDCACDDCIPMCE